MERTMLQSRPHENITMDNKFQKITIELQRVTGRLSDPLAACRIHCRTHCRSQARRGRLSTSVAWDLKHYLEVNLTRNNGSAID